MFIPESPNHKLKTLDRNYGVESSEKEEEMQEAIHKVIFRIAASLVLMIMLCWILYTGFQLAIKRKGEEYDRYAFSIGIFTFVLGLIYVAIGLTIVAEVVLNLTNRLQILENMKETEKKTIHKDRVRYSITSISIFLLLWAGFKLATELTTEEGKCKCNHLGFLVGIISIAFGVTYLIIGTAIVVDLIRNLILRMNYKKKRKIVKNEILAINNLNRLTELV